MAIQRVSMLSTGRRHANKTNWGTWLSLSYIHIYIERDAANILHSRSYMVLPSPEIYDLRLTSRAAPIVLCCLTQGGLGRELVFSESQSVPATITTIFASFRTRQLFMLACPKRTCHLNTADNQAHTEKHRSDVLTIP